MVSITTFLQDLAGGGAERVAVTLLNAFAIEHEVTLILARPEGPYLADLSPQIRLIPTGAASTAASIPFLARWLRKTRPDILFTHLTHVNVAGAIAARLARTGTAHVAVEHNQMDLNYPRIRQRSVRAAYRVAGWIYPRVSALVSVSEGVRDSVRRFTGIPRNNLHVIANPVVTPELRRRLLEEPAHPWLRDGGPPVILGCGRLVEQKDFGTLIEAFGLLLQKRPVRLLILGEGEQREALQRQIAQNGLGDAVALPGFDRNPYAAMRAARLFALSSRWEGLPTVLIEALAAGVNVVATDCPSGPAEILEGGIGRLVPVSAPRDLADAMNASLEAPLAAALLSERAEAYSLEISVARYQALFERLAVRQGRDQTSRGGWT
ncbi:glycosyltransferase [Sphingomonas sp. LY54]|uniref:glycosyltransferase n=1 Tax=Sphingomonas sp. LY54 TaxID=3095343 RepID=UPI002D79610C|nr:glycosyltransferase [Sphingomonas sp. LY54]WRP28216.1 glycosyltransferase [Sphingomonas sp. LY54]